MATQDVAVISHAAVSPQKKVFQGGDDVAASQTSLVSRRAGCDRVHPNTGEIIAGEGFPVDAKGLQILAFFQLSDDVLGQVAADGKVLPGFTTAVVDPDNFSKFIDQRAARVSRINGGVMLDDVVHGSPGGLASSPLLGDDPLGKGELRFSKRETSGIDFQADLNRAFVPV